MHSLSMVMDIPHPRVIKAHDLREVLSINYPVKLSHV